MWVEMLNSNQALMETNLQGAVAVAIVTAAKLETQTWLLLDSFGALVSTWCQGRGSCRAGVHPWLRGGWSSWIWLRSTRPLPVFVPSPAHDGKSESAAACGQGASTAWGAGGRGTSCGCSHTLSWPEQSPTEAQGAKCPSHELRLVHSVQNRRGHLGTGSSRDAAVDAGGYSEHRAGRRGICSSSLSPSAPQIGGTHKVLQPFTDICAPSRTAAPRRSRGDLTVASCTGAVPNLPWDYGSPCAAGGWLCDRSSPYSWGVS